VCANGLEFGLLEAGSGPLALCLHGFPDTAHTWRHPLPVLAGAGFHAVAPFMRGYAPTAVPADGAYQLGALIPGRRLMRVTSTLAHDWLISRVRMSIEIEDTHVQAIMIR
jgi:pimeloyl-ACP methyl ester carboxylesterase